MEDKKSPFNPISGIIDEEEQSSQETNIEEVTVIIRIEGEKNPVCLDIKSEPLKTWIVNAIADKELSEDNSHEF